MKSGAATKSEISVRANGARYNASAFTIATPVTAQLVNLASDGCWESRFTTTEAQKSDTSIFRARFPN
ncbi:MAG: hypothetical protein ABIR79_22160 [Candidatus Binatia bacterium]